MTSIMACLDGSSLSPVICQYSRWASQQLAAPITLLHVIDKSQYPPQQDLSGNIGLGSSEQLLAELSSHEEKHYRSALAQGYSMLEAMQKQLAAATPEKVEIRQRHGDLTDNLLALQDQYQLVIIGKQGHNSQTEHTPLGSQLTNLIRHLETPLLVVSGQFTTPRSLMLAFDGSAHSDKCLTALITDPLFRGLTIHLVAVGAEATSKLAEAQQLLIEQGITTQSVSLTGQVATALSHYQQTHQLDLIMMGAYGHSRLRQLLIGSTTTQLLRTSHVPLVLIR